MKLQYSKTYAAIDNDAGGLTLFKPVLNAGWINALATESKAANKTKDCIIYNLFYILKVLLVTQCVARVKKGVTHNPDMCQCFVVRSVCNKITGAIM